MIQAFLAQHDDGWHMKCKAGGLKKDRNRRS